MYEVLTQLYPHFLATVDGEPEGFHLDLERKYVWESMGKMRAEPIDKMDVAKMIPPL